MSDVKVVTVDFQRKQQKSHSNSNEDKRAAQNNSQLDISEVCQIMTSIGDITYYWDVVSGEITYSDNVWQMAPFIDIHKISNISGFAAAMDPENVTNRYQSV